MSDAGKRFGRQPEIRQNSMLGFQGSQSFDMDLAFNRDMQNRVSEMVVVLRDVPLKKITNP